MDQDDSRQADAAHGGERRNPKTRTWTARCTGELRYTRYTERDGLGKLRIYFAIHLPPGQENLHPDVFRVFDEHKRSETGHPNDMRFRNDPVRGKTFSLPNHERGRAIADRIDALLLDLARRLDERQDRGRS